MLSNKYKFLFIHIPKTAGTSIENYFLNMGIGSSIIKSESVAGDLIPGIEEKNGHPFYKNIRYIHLPLKFFDELPDDYFKFAFVRNPWDRCVSEYKWRIKNNFSFPTNNGSKKKMSFKGYIRNVYNLVPSRELAKIHFMPQYDFIENEKTPINFVGRFENLNNDFKIICEKIGINYGTLPELNKTDGSNYQEYFDKDSRDMIFEKYRKDIEFFNYKFGE